MSTPLGWARANIFYEKMPGPPKPGTLAELLCIMVWKARQSEMVARTRAVAQASLGGEQAVDAFSEYRDMVNRVELQEKADKMRERLEEVKKIKAIRFRPLEDQIKQQGPALRTVSRDQVLPQVPEQHRLRPITRTRPRRKER